MDDELLGDGTVAEYVVESSLLFAAAAVSFSRMTEGSLKKSSSSVFAVLLENREGL